MGKQGLIDFKHEELRGSMTAIIHAYTHLLNGISMFSRFESAVDNLSSTDMN
jgi:hypothetical protein